MAIKILATGDLHIGKKAAAAISGGSGYSSGENWLRIVKWSIGNSVNAVMLSGDIIDRDNRFFEAVGPLHNGFELLRDANIPVFLVCGNHDYDVLPQIVNTGKFPNVHILGGEGEWEVKKYIFPDGTVQFIGWSFPAQFVSGDPFDNFSITSLISPELPSIGLLHTQIDAASSPYAPVSTSRLTSSVVNTWVLGHIHKPCDLDGDLKKYYYPGSPLSLSSKEPGEHGPLLFEIENNTIKKPERVLLSPLRFEQLSVDVTGADSHLILRERIINTLKIKGESILKSHPELKNIIVDLIIEGEHNSPDTVQKWCSGIEESLALNIGYSLQLNVRSIDFLLHIPMDQLIQLSGQNTPLGVLANIISLIEQGNENETINSMVKEWISDYNTILSSATFSPLSNDINTSDMRGNELEEFAKRAILKESYRLLGTLRNQKSVNL